MLRQLKIGTASVRGVVGEALSPELVASFACAFGTWCAEGRAVVVGRDTRGSSEMLRAAVLSGLLATGCEVIDLGVCPTPLLSFAVRELGADGGLAVTGSHNEADWNALKFLGPDGALLNAVKSEELMDIYHAARFSLAPGDRLHALGAAPELAGRYHEHLLAALDVEAIRARHFKVAVDFCNGAVAAVARGYFDALGCTLVPVNDAPTGQFAHPPAPSPAHMRQLADEVTSARAPIDIGAAINVDGDRVAFVTGQGTALSEECTLPLVATARLRRRPGTVVTNLSTSRMVDEVARGQKVLRAAVGESHVIDLGVGEGAVLAGEGNGGVAVLPVSMTFDGLLALGLVLEEMAVSGATLAELTERLPRLAMSKLEVPCPPHVVHRVVESFRTRYAEWSPDTSDGVRVARPDGWLHVRASNTEPLLRIIAEASTAARSAILLDEALAHAAATMGKA
jgi:phosphomannomutase